MRKDPGGRPPTDRGKGSPTSTIRLTNAEWSAADRNAKNASETIANLIREAARRCGVFKVPRK